MFNSLEQITIAQGFLNTLRRLKDQNDLYDEPKRSDGIDNGGKHLSEVAKSCIKHLSRFCCLTCSTDSPSIQVIETLIKHSEEIIEAAQAAMPKTKKGRKA